MNHFPTPHPKNSLEWRLQSQIEHRRINGTLRTLLPIQSAVEVEKSSKSKMKKQKIDFCSNDYLGLARCPQQLVKVEKMFEYRLNHSKTSATELSSSETMKLGSTGSRLLSGNVPLPRCIEADLALFHNRPDALLFNSGYDANLSLLSSIPIRGRDVIIMDELVHNSLRMGIRMSRKVNRKLGVGATAVVEEGDDNTGENDDIILFRHNDVEDLRNKLANLPETNRTKGRLQEISNGGVVIIVVESVYSMDGDVAPLDDILNSALKFGASVIV